MRIVKNIQKYSVYYCLGVSALLLVYFFFIRFQIAITRYFDVDEFAHLWWANHMRMGLRPYVDFLLFFPTGFHWFLAPLFGLGSGTFPVIAGRVLMFAVFVGMCMVAAVLFWFMRKSWLALVVPVLLAFLPLPFDKYIEIRPDNLATLIFLIGILAHVGAMRVRRPLFWLIAGACYSLSILVITKMIPYVGLAIGVACCWGWFSERSYGMRITLVKQHLGPFFLGGIVPFILFTLWLISLGNLDTVMYSLTQLPLEANKISAYFIMMPDLFFYPNSVFYGQVGWPQGLIVNHAVWVIGMVFAVYRLVTPYLTTHKDRIWEEILVAIVFLAHVVMYVQFIPLKHTQYLIPIGIFVAWYTTDALFAIYKILDTRFVGRVVWIGGFTLCAILLYQTFGLSAVPKLAWTNADSIVTMEKVFRTVPADEHILDLDGRTLYYPSPYYACCIPFGQFATFLSRPLPSLSKALEKTKTKYIYQGQLERVKTLDQSDQAYIREHYKPLGGDIQILVRTD